MRITVSGSYIDSEEVMRLLDLRTSSSLAQPPYKDAIRPVAHNLYSYRDVIKFMEDREARYWFLCQIQSLVMFILDESKLKKGQVANKLGFKNIGSLDNFLEAQTSSAAARVGVKAWRHFRELVKEYDRYMGYTK